MEQGEGYRCQNAVLAVERGQDASLRIECEDGYTVRGADVDAELTALPGGAYLLTIPQVRYSLAVAPTVEKSALTLRYFPNDGSDTPPTEVPVTASHLRSNTATALFRRDGYALTGWNTAPDGSGEEIALGARTEASPGLQLYAQWCKLSPAGDFAY